MPRTKPTRSSLQQYRSRRDFRTSPEPTGSARRRRTPRPIFCVQKHLASHLHYDFRLEHRGVLLSWAVPKGPSLNPADKRLAMRVEDHPLDYASFEGVIPEGYGAGVVMLWDTGTWRPSPDTPDIDAALKKGELKFTLAGVKLKGSWVLVRTRRGPRGSAGDGRSWLLIKHRDEWAGPVDVTELAPRSVKSRGDFADILAAEKPDTWQPHLAARGGAAGRMMRDVIEEATRLKLRRTPQTRRKTKQNP